MLDFSEKDETMTNDNNNNSQPDLQNYSHIFAHTNEMNVRFLDCQYNFFGVFFAFFVSFQLKNETTV